MAAGAAVAGLLGPGDVVLLDGELGAGKTTFVKGLAAAAGVIEPVTSPTFTLMRRYRTTLGADLVHVDIYRLERLSEIVELGLPELLEDGAFAVVEWGTRAVPVLGADYLGVEIAFGADGRARALELQPRGDTWRSRWGALVASLADYGQ
jgi:tRNA threonylcarbamoyladenosine biosynthesis protein TsaE